MKIYTTWQKKKKKSTGYAHGRQLHTKKKLTRGNRKTLLEILRKLLTRTARDSKSIADRN